MARHRKRQFGEIQELESRIPGRGPRYRARYMGPDGRRYSAPTFESFGAAEAWLNNVQADEVQWSFNDAGSSSLLTVPENTQFKYVVMPMRI